VRGYLLDTNHVEAFFRKEPSIIQKVRTIPAERLIWVCSITLGEIEAGHAMTQTTNQTVRDEYVKFVRDNFLDFRLDVSEFTPEQYAKIMRRIWRKHPPSSSNKKTEQHLLDLGVDINDVWLVAVALEHGLTFVTRDKMTCIKEAVGVESFDNWLEVK
jgi:tRNA(fMet)-specific endonuclease VapC